MCARIWGKLQYSESAVLVGLTQYVSHEVRIKSVKQQNLHCFLIVSTSAFATVHISYSHTKPILSVA